MPKQRGWTQDELIDAVSNSTSYAQVIKKLGLIPAGGNYKQLKKYINELNLDISHFCGQGWSAGKKRVDSKPRFSLEQILTENSHYQSNRLKYRLIKEEIFIWKCYRCERKTWLDGLIPLELEHINGINTDNRLENLTLLCPNCHSFTDTYRGKNRNKRV